MKRFVFALFAIAFLLGVTVVNGQGCGDTSPRIGIMSAFDAELTKLLSETDITSTCSINGVEFTLGNIEGNQAVLMLSGVSMVNASMNTQLLLDHFNITHLVFSGIAGGVDPSLNIGDVAVPAQWAQYQEAIFARETAPDTFTLSSRQTASIPNFGMMYPQPVNIRTANNPEGMDKEWFEVDPQMLSIAEQVAAKVELLSCNSDNQCLSNPPKVVVGGNGVSGQTFVDNAKFRTYAFHTFRAHVLDMETAATATVAYVNGVPFLAFRSLSDLAGGGPGENEIGTFFAVAADNSASVLTEFLTEWSEQ